jgi:hypothetical protein
MKITNEIWMKIRNDIWRNDIWMNLFNETWMKNVEKFG